MKDRLKILSSYWFLLNLTILLLNDFVLKSIYSNAITGKVSDFAGLFIFPIFWSVLFPKHKLKIYAFTALFFIFWKSPFSESFILWWNHFSILPIDRVVDLTDLFALSMLPVAYFFQKNYTPPSKIKVSPVFPLLLASFAFMATSYRTDVTIFEKYKVNYSKDSLAKRLNQLKVFQNDVHFSSNTIDTVNVFLSADFCRDGFDLTLIVEEMNPNETILFFSKAEYDCPREDDDRKKIIDALEKLVIDQLE